MKSLKIFTLMMLMLVAITGCSKEESPVVSGDNAVVGQWVLTSWNEEAPEFNVYLSFENDGTFAIYQ
jgi:phage protein U